MRNLAPVPRRRQRCRRPPSPIPPLRREPPSALARHFPLEGGSKPEPCPPPASAELPLPSARPPELSPADDGSRNQPKQPFLRRQESTNKSARRQEHPDLLRSMITEERWGREARYVPRGFLPAQEWGREGGRKGRSEVPHQVRNDGGAISAERRRGHQCGTTEERFRRPKLDLGPRSPAVQPVQGKAETRFRIECGTTGL